MKQLGEPITGVLHTTDASSGVEVPIFSDGSRVARTLKSNEYIVVYSISVVSVAGGDVTVFIGADGTVGTGETLLRGTYGANGGERRDFTMFSGRAGESVWLDAPAGVCDVVFHGAIRVEGDNTGVRPEWKEAQLGQ